MTIDPRHIELSPEMKQALAEKAEQLGLPWSEVFTEALRNFRSSRNRQRVASSSRSFYDAMLEEGAIGLAKSHVALRSAVASLSVTRSTRRASGGTVRGWHG